MTKNHAGQGRALADFMVELEEENDLAVGTLGFNQPEKTPNMWKLFLDRASGKGHCSEGILLTSSDHLQISYALRFAFKATNNKVEYETLHVCLKLAHRIGAKSIAIFSDLQVIANQFRG